SEHQATPQTAATVVALWNEVHTPRVSAGTVAAVIGFDTPTRQDPVPVKTADSKPAKRSREPQKTKSDHCKVSAKSDPVSSAVFIDGKKVCEQTPCSFEVAPEKNVAVEFRAPGFHPETKRVDASGKRASVSARLVKSL